MRLFLVICKQCGFSKNRRMIQMTTIIDRMHLSRCHFFGIQKWMRLFGLLSTTMVLWKLAPSLQCFSCKWVSFSFFLDNGASQLVSDFALGCLWLLMSTRNQIWGRPGESLPGTKTRKNTEAASLALCGFHQNLSPNISHFLVWPPKTLCSLRPLCGQFQLKIECFRKEGKGEKFFSKQHCN